MLPDFLVDHLEVVSVNETQEILHLYFEEKAKAPKEFDILELVSKVFVDEITIQDFPLRGKFGYLHIKDVVGPIRPLEKSLKKIGI